MDKLKYIFLWGLLSISFATVIAQPTKVRGKVVDAATGEVMPFVSVVFQGTTEGASTDFDGNYFMETREEVDSIEVSFLGYHMQTLPVNKHSFKTINVALKENVAMLEEVVVTYKKKENPAHRIVRGIIANKKRNNPKKANSYLYDAYTKMELSLTNIDEKFKKKKILKKFDFIFDYVDTSAVTGKAYLPFMITETKSKVFNSNDPKFTKERIIATKISGFDGDNTSILQFTGQLYQDFNIYDNYIKLFDQGFISPLNNSALLFYKYYLTDSVKRDNDFLYHLSFKPKNPKDATFTGNFWVTAEDFAITDITMRVTNKVNVNWVNDVMISEKFAKKEDSIWFWKNRELMVDFTLFKGDSIKQKGFLGKSSVHYDNVKFNQLMPEQFQKMANNIEVEDGALEKEDLYWDSARPYELSKSEKGIYAMVDSIKNVPLYRTIVDVLTTALTGYYDFGGIEMGPYYKLLSFNKIEGKRFQLGGRTNSDWNEKVQLSGHAAYGTKDKEWKYGAGILYRLNKKNDLWEAVEIGYSHDMEQLGKGSSIFLTAGNLLASILSRGDSDKLTLQNELFARYEKEWLMNFSSNISLKHRELLPSEYVPFTPMQQGEESSIGEKISTREIGLGLRWAPRQRVVRRTFNRNYIARDFPILNLNLTLGFGNYNYQKVDFLLEHKVPIFPIGHMYYFGKAGKIWGQVPFPLLHLHEGNETYVYDTYAYNLMNYYEFASDMYASLGIEHHFMGFFLNKIPLLKKMNMRTVVTGKALWGTLRKENNGMLPGYDAPLLFPKGLSDLEKPYFEAGVGIENIFKVARVDAVWRLSHRNTGKDSENFGIRATLQLKF